MVRPQKKGSSSSRKIRHISGISSVAGHLHSSRVYKPKEIQSIRKNARVDLSEPSQLDDPDLMDTRGDEGGPWVDIDFVEGVLQGNSTVETSHQGGELDDLVVELEENMYGNKKRRDWRTRRDRVEKRTAAFKPQLESMANTYMTWSYGLKSLGADPGDIEECSLPYLDVTLVDVFAVRKGRIYIDGALDASIGAAFIRQGFVPCSPLNPSVAISTRTFEFLVPVSLHCPKLSAHTFVKGLAAIHGTVYRPYLYQQFLIAIDLYHDLTRVVERRVKIALGHASRDWQLKNACPCCMYELEGEKQLRYRMLFAMDGNNSLKRMKRLAGSWDEDGEKVTGSGPSIERKDSQVILDDQYLSREEVDKWARENWGVWEEVKEEENLCEQRWRNMNEGNTARSWSMYEETGIFIALCRHSFVLVIADMVESGEMFKYPLAVVHRLLTELGECLGGGYDIGCKFGSTLCLSPLGRLAKEQRYKSLVPIFHGHGHNRLCQTENLGTYVEGVGKEDLEACERFFSRSNDLASSVCHASSFHRHQTISAYIRHTDDFETFQRLSKFLVDKFMQAAQILKTEDAVKKSLEVLGVTSFRDVELWLNEEKTYLASLKKEPEDETIRMDYFRALRKYYKALEAVKSISLVWVTSTDQLPERSGKATELDKQRRRMVEDVDTARNNVVALERRMGISPEARWTSDSTDWKEAETLVKRATYQRCLDKLESLIVARLFELTRMNRSHTGYNLRSHIGKAIKARSQAIKTALNNFNEAAAALFPDRAALEWDEVVKYAFLADFDLLRETRLDIREKPWATPGGRAALDGYYQLQ
ncbi:hypothetical protein E1B28_010551 [Marasmius oreades]|uniref:CxC1-like cysteine cluster associated with KDZ transposases domain-containing protein n=1 Tax=Marasmius oreades TaxID=181124 RepID=A0A9P7RY11_9AGAR|nr:uncharacterized protein E1B28_010551 [Marasmius oreades]KAG7091522.1 hypothetical protein E1B28_010551 [Marasmius oreades]